MNYFLLINGQIYLSEKVPLEPFVKTLFGKPTDIRPYHNAVRQSCNKRCRLDYGLTAILNTLSDECDNQEFTERLKTMGVIKMKNGFLTKHHQRCFEQAIERIDKNNNVMMSAVYLLTADYKLWKQAKRFVEKNRICFGTFKPTDCTETGYTAFCAAKDVYLGLKHFTFSDLADKNLISPFLFELLCMAMAIKRYGVKILDIAKIRNSNLEGSDAD